MGDDLCRSSATASAAPRVRGCAHWWALAHHCLRALFAIHELSVVHLDIKGDNVCIPVSPPTFDPKRARARAAPRFESLALIDFAFSLISRERLDHALPIGWQTDTTTSRRGSCRRSKRADAATCSRRASSTGAATATASPRCCALPAAEDAGYDDGDGLVVRPRLAPPRT
jgi:hypothetical protein